MKTSWTSGRRGAAIALAGGAALVASGVAAQQYGGWSSPVSAETADGSDQVNTVSNDGCPILSPDGLSLYMATNRAGGEGGQDIWRATRATTTSPWDAPQPLTGINTADHEYCPTPVRGRGLYFVRQSAAAAPGAGNADVYFAREANGGWTDEVALNANINSAGAEWSPSLFEDDAGNVVFFFSSNRAGGMGGQDIYYSVNWGPAQPATSLNTAANDMRPNVRRNGREIVFDSNRPGAAGFDVYIASRADANAPFDPPEAIAAVNSAGNETRPSLSWDGSILLFGSDRPGGEGAADIYVSTRPRADAD